MTTTAPSRASVCTSYDQVFGRVRDVDSHEMVPARLWAQEFGAQFEPLAEFYLKTQSPTMSNSFTGAKVVDDEPITPQTVATSWGKACEAPSAIDIRRRMAFMDAAGIEDGFIFGGVMSIIGLQFMQMGDELFRQWDWKLPMDARSYGREMVVAFNDWCLRVGKISPRLRPVPTIAESSLEANMEEVERVVEGGARAIFLPAAVHPFGGKAPCHPDNDLLWNYCAERNITVIVHVGGERNLLTDATSWVNTPQFAASKDVVGELATNPFSMSVSSLGAQAFLANVVMGGVFERVPNLRMGMMEVGGHWVGSWAVNLDTWALELPRTMKKILSKPPSFYIERNVRVSPFAFEPVDRYFDRYPFLQNVLCFASDFPHVEGGKRPREDLAGKLERFGPEVIEKFFVTNADWVMPR